MQTDVITKVPGRGLPEFEEVVELHYRALYQFALGLTGSEADAWDLTQHTFYTWSTKGDQLRDPSKVKSWLFTTLYRAFLQDRRKEVRLPHYELSQIASELPTVLPPKDSQLDSEKVLEALDNMEEAFRAPLTLFYLDDCPYKQIASILGVPIGTVKSRISRGIAQLQRLLGSEDSCPQQIAA